MQRQPRFGVLIWCATALALSACNPKPGPPASLSWAYPKAAEAPLPQPGPGLHRIPGSVRTFIAAELNDDRNPVDWKPEQHPLAPGIVAHGREGGPTPCAECHLFNGGGFIGAPDLAGLPAAYIVQQVQEFRAGRRLSAEPRRPATHEMIEVAQRVTDAELVQAAAYFASLPRRPRYRVVETGRVPATRPDYYGWLDLVPGGGFEPIRGRVVEAPEDTSRMFLADPDSGAVVYVPSGALTRGAALVQTGGRGGQACASCHGADLKGAGEAPPLAGRAATYLARMLWDIRSGARNGPAVALMQMPAAGLSAADVTDIAAYLASLKP